MIGETVDERTLRVLLERGVIPARLTERDVGFLRAFGIFNDRVRYEVDEFGDRRDRARSGRAGSFGQFRGRRNKALATISKAVS